MQLISSKETLEFLSKVAPAAWVKRMLMWMMFDDVIRPYIKKGHIRSQVTKLELLVNLEEYDSDLSENKIEHLLKSNFEHEGDEFIANLMAAERFEKIDGATVEWDETEEAHAIGFGFLLYADNLDWEQGEITSTVYSGLGDIEDHLFWDSDDHFPVINNENVWIAEFEGLSFDKSVIEMMLPTNETNFVSGGASISTQRKFTGRPNKWNWEGAMTYIISQAQHPDGLPDGHGAQAQIENMIQKWFVDETGETPAISQIRGRASKIMYMVNNSNSPK